MITYLLKVTLCSGCLLLFYRLVLEREKMFRFNRFYLLGGLVVSILLPLIPLEILVVQPLFSPPPAAVALAERGIQARYAVALLPEPTLPQTFQWTYLMGIGYLMIGGTLLFRFGKNILRLMQRIRGCEVRKLDGIRAVLVDSPTLPYSFLTYVFLPKATYLQGTLEREVLDHERAHVRQWHSLDILFVEFLKVLFWFNPAFYFYRNAIALNHEFLADEAVLRTYRDVPAYQYLLLQKVNTSSHQLFISQFNYSFTKKRFVMMNKQTSRSRALLTQSAVFPLLAVIFFAFSDLTLAQIAPPPPPVERVPPPPPPIERTATSDTVKEYNALVDKYLRKPTPTSTIVEMPSATDANRMESLIAKMNTDQAASLKYVVFTLPPSPKSIPTKEEYEKYKDPKIYGIWINDKKVSNSTLDKYKPSDFSYASVSKLYLNAQKTIGYKYKYQLNMMTNDYYNADLRDRIKNPHKYLRRNPNYKK